MSETKFIDDASLISYWQMSDANDYKGANNGTGTSMSYSAGKFGNAGDFSGTTAYITYSSQVIPLGAKTINCWVKSNSTSQYQVIVDNARTTTAAHGTSVYLNQTTGYITFSSTKATAGTARFYFLSTIGVCNGSWHMITCTWDGTTNANGAKIYINGMLNNQATAATTESTNATDNLRMGALSNDGTALELNGSIDDVAIFSRALSSTEVQELYQGMTAGEYIPNSSTAGYWRLNGNSMDYSSNANNGTDANITYGTAYGRFGQGGSFNGTSSKITFASQVIPLGAKTISIWVKSSSNADYKVILDNCNSSSSNNGTYIDVLATTGYIAFCSYKGTAGVSRFELVDDVSVTDGNWHMVTCTWDGTTSSNMAKIYIDGVLTAQGTAAATESTNATYNLTLGAQYNSTYEMNGYLDEVIIESRAWSAQEIRNYYTQSKGRFTNN